MIRASWPTTGAASARSRPLPWGRPSTMSTSTTSASPASAMRWAAVAPTLPAPTTVTLLRAMTRRPSGYVPVGLDCRVDEGSASALARRRHRDVAVRLVHLDRARGSDGLADAVGVAREVLVEHPRE